MSRDDINGFAGFLATGAVSMVGLYALLSWVGDAPFPVWPVVHAYFFVAGLVTAVWLGSGLIGGRRHG